MGPELGELVLTIVKWVDDYQPGIVACELVDAQGRQHNFVGKVPIFSAEDHLDANSTYPRRGALRCTVLSRWKKADGQELVKISIAEPDGEKSIEGLQNFVVLMPRYRAFREDTERLTLRATWFGSRMNSSRPE